MKKQVLIIGIILVLLFVGLSGCSSDNNPLNTITPKSNIQIIGQPITRTGYSGVDYCAFIDVTVQNTGNADGSANVFGELKQDANTVEKKQSVYLKSGESDLITLTFCELSFWTGSSYTYRAWIE